MSYYMFSGASNFTISGGNFVNRTHMQTSALDKISAAAAHTALHDAPTRTDESRCHQHTRTKVLQKLEHWMQGALYPGVFVFWMYGGAGAGKTAVMRTLAERSVAQGIALGSFFFSRSDPTRNTAEVLIPTLVYQLAQLFPSALQVLDKIFHSDPLIVKKSLTVQLLKLFVPILEHLVQVGIISDRPQSPRVFLVDGLDECTESIRQQAIIQAAAAVCHEHRIPVKFLISSRPEQAISTAFEWYQNENRFLNTISLSDDPDAENDIRQFIEGELQKIRLQHPFHNMIPLEWPALYDVNRLVSKSSSHFIYASTAIKHIWSAKENPVRSLQVVLGLEVSRTISPFSELDILYRHILESAAHLDKVLQVLAHCLLTELPSLASVICIMLDCSRDDLLIYMDDVTPLVALTKAASRYITEEEGIQLLHASLGDFLGDQSRSGSLHVNKEIYLASKLERCFQLLNLYSRKQTTTPSWPVYSSRVRDVTSPYQLLSKQVITTIETSGHLPATQEVLKQYNFRTLYQCQLRFQQEFDHLTVIQFLSAVQRIETPDGCILFRRSAEDFFDILESHINSENTPLAHAILPLIFLGYPDAAVRRALAHHFKFNAFYGLLRFRWHSRPTLSHITAALLTSNPARHIAHTSPDHLSLIAEEILGYLINGETPPSPLAYSAHKLWLQRAKPGKHIATGAPMLASVFRARCFSLLARSRKSTHFSRKSNVGDTRMGRLRSLSTLLDLAGNLLNALLWVLPRAGFSKKIVLYSQRTFPRVIYHHKRGLVGRVRKCIDEYNVRVRDAMLGRLRQGVEDGDVNALIEKSRMLFLDAQD